MRVDLSPGDAQALRDIAARDDGLFSRRARAILRWIEEPDAERAGAACGLRPDQVRFWVRAFERSGLGVFPPGLLPTEGGETVAPAPTPGAAADAVPAPAAPAMRPSIRRARRLRIRADDPVIEVLGRIVAMQRARLKRLEAGARAGDEEAVHDMRVAIRRLRAALRIGRPYLKRKAVRRLRRGLRAAARALGAVRDLDVILRHAEAYRAQASVAGDGLGAWTAELEGQRAEARQALQAYLAGKRFTQLLADLDAFLGDPGRYGAGDAAPDAGANAPPRASGRARVRDMLPAAVWEQFGAVRSYETLSTPSIQALHALRIEIKRFRYLLEFFQGTLGVRSVRPTLELAVRAQDHLGRLHDADVARQRLQAFFAAQTWSATAESPAAAGYLAALEAEITALTASFPALGEELTGLPVRRRLARVLARI
jgi:CHAD domain-containing protein